MIAYHADGNLILQQAFKTRSDKHRIAAYNSIMTRLAACGLSVDLQILDNEASAAYKQAITFTWQSKFQLVLPEMHCCNRAECAIRLSRTTSSPSLRVWTSPSPHTFGTYSFLRQRSLSTYFDSRPSTLGSQPGSSSMGLLTLTRLRLLRWVVMCSSMPSPSPTDHGISVRWMASTLDRHSTCIAVSHWSRATPRTKSSPTQSSFVMPTAPYLFPCLTTKSSMAFKFCPVPSLMHRSLHPFPRLRPLPIYVVYSSRCVLSVRLHQARAASCPPDIQGCPSRSLQGWPHPLPPR
jgi:hypothetical protein